MVVKTHSLRIVIGTGGAGRRFLMRHFASPAQRNHHHVPAVSSTSFVRSFAACSVPSSSSLYQSPCDYYDRIVNGRTSSVSEVSDILPCTRRLVSSTPGASPPSETQAQYFEGPWHEKYWLLGEYKKKHGNCLVPKSYAIGDVKLGVWVDKQRQMYKKGKLSANRREKLDAIGFSWDPKADKLERNFALLEQFREREGHCDVPYGYEEDGAKLGQWVCGLRQQYKKGKLDYSYQRRLDNLGMSWDPLADQWERYFALLEQYKKREDHCNVPQRCEESEVNLGTWVCDQRRQYKKGKLDESYQRRLENLGMSWDPKADQWETNFVLFEQYRKREGHCNVPKTHEEDEVKLGKWVDWQRQLYKNGKLDESYQQRLENLGMSWDPLAEQWEMSFALLEQYKVREGHCDVPRKYEESGVNLGIWVVKQRQLFKKGKLDEFYQRRLENLGMSWGPLADQWERNFALLKQFLEREGHCNVPRSHEEDGVQLGEWISRQRKVRKGSVGGTLGADRIERLDKLGIRWSFTELNADQWERKFGLFQQYKKREGHCDVPISHEEAGIKLGSWLATQRQVRKGKEGILGADRIERLDNLGIRW